MIATSTQDPKQRDFRVVGNLEMEGETEILAVTLTGTTQSGKTIDYVRICLGMSRDEVERELGIPDLALVGEKNRNHPETLCLVYHNIGDAYMFYFEENGPLCTIFVTGGY
jgi:hypothetical protein